MDEVSRYYDCISLFPPCFVRGPAVIKGEVDLPVHDVIHLLVGQHLVLTVPRAGLGHLGRQWASSPHFQIGTKLRVSAEAPLRNPWRV